MDANAKKLLREKIGKCFDVASTRLKDSEAEILSSLIDNYDNYRGTSRSETHKFSDYCSDGKYTRTETTTYTYTDTPGVRVDYEYHDDDGQSGTSSTLISTARGMLNLLKTHLA